MHKEICFFFAFWQYQYGCFIIIRQSRFKIQSNLKNWTKIHSQRIISIFSFRINNINACTNALPSKLWWLDVSYRLIFGGSQKKVKKLLWFYIGIKRRRKKMNQTNNPRRKIVRQRVNGKRTSSLERRDVNWHTHG